MYNKGPVEITSGYIYPIQTDLMVIIISCGSVLFLQYGDQICREALFSMIFSITKTKLEASTCVPVMLE